jgi:hypothetical protein
MLELWDYRKGVRRLAGDDSLIKIFKMAQEPERMIYNVAIEEFDIVRFFNYPGVRLHFVMDGNCVIALAWVTKYNPRNKSGWINSLFMKGVPEENKGDIALEALDILMSRDEYRLLFAEMVDLNTIQYARKLGFKPVGKIPDARWNHAMQEYEDTYLYYYK